MVVITASGTSIGLRITGQLVAAAPAAAVTPPTHDAAVAARFWREMTALELQAPQSPEVARLAAMLPWMAHDALIHYLAPRGLEQYSGGGWGTRDVSQGPVEFLLSLGHVSPVCDLLRQVFRNQNADGDWPQWFMFPPFQQIQSRHAHGDVVIWPLKALCDYLEHANDAAILHDRLPYTDDDDEYTRRSTPALTIVSSSATMPSTLLR